MLGTMNSCKCGACCDLFWYDFILMWKCSWKWQGKRIILRYYSFKTTMKMMKFLRFELTWWVVRVWAFKTWRCRRCTAWKCGKRGFAFFSITFLTYWSFFCNLPAHQVNVLCLCFCTRPLAIIQMRYVVRFLQIKITFEASLQNRHGECLFGGLLWNFVSLASFLIVDLSFALIGQNFVRLWDHLEFFGTILVFVGAGEE